MAKDTSGHAGNVGKTELANSKIVHREGGGSFVRKDKQHHSTSKGDPTRLELYIDPGDATADDLRDLMVALSDLNVAVGGDGLIFREDGHLIVDHEGVER